MVDPMSLKREKKNKLNSVNVIIINPVFLVQGHLKASHKES